MIKMISVVDHEITAIDTYYKNKILSTSVCVSSTSTIARFFRRFLGQDVTFR